MPGASAAHKVQNVTIEHSPASPLHPGRASAGGCGRYIDRVIARDDTALDASFYRPLGRDGVRVASIGLGSYLGECDDQDDRRYATVARAALADGINLFDAAVNYRCQRAERALGAVLASAFARGEAARDEVVVCTKGGYIPLDATAPSTRDEYRSYVETEYIATGLARPEDIVAGGHCIAPAYLADQVARSRRNLRLGTIDVYYLHNPEQQLDAVTPSELAVRLRAAFAALEERCAAGDIATYGCATWNGLRVPPDARGHLSLASLVSAAEEVAGASHHFRVVQLPVNLALPEAVRVPTQQVNGRTATVLEAAAELGLSLVASAALMQGALASNLPDAVRSAIPGLATDAQRAITFVRSLPVISSALVGMKSLAHLTENLASVAPSPAA